MFNSRCAIFIALFSACCSFVQAQTAMQVSGGAGNPVVEKPPASTGISAVYLFNTLTDSKIVFTSAEPSVLFYKYTFSLADAQLISGVETQINGSNVTYTVRNLEDSRAYCLMVNGVYTDIVWITDYTQHLPQLNSITAVEDPETRCQWLQLSIDKDDRLEYYANSGATQTLSRLYNIEYQTLKWDADNFLFTEITQKVSENAFIVGTDVTIEPAPLLDTRFVLTGDQYASQLGLQPATISSDWYSACRTEPHIEFKVDTSHITTNLALEASEYASPANVSLYAHSNEPVTTYYTWNIYKMPNRNDYLARYTDQNVKYIFNDDGDYRIVLEVSNASLQSPCVSSDSLDFKVSQTYLDIPNFFSPGESPGQNDEFRVAYRSLNTFHCTIFNRWGNKLFEFTDPSKGWDGRYGGKYVQPGVYFYVIEYTTSQGKKKIAKGNINIISGKGRK